MDNDEKRTLVWGLWHGKPEAVILIGDHLSATGKELMYEQYPGDRFLGFTVLPADAPKGLDELKKLYPCPEIKKEE
jgi:hypothetical protein